MTMRVLSAVFGSHFDHSTCSGPLAIKSHVTPFRSRPMPPCGPHRMWEQHHAITGPSGYHFRGIRYRQSRNTSKRRRTDGTYLPKMSTHKMYTLSFSLAIST